MKNAVHNQITSLDKKQLTKVKITRNQLHSNLEPVKELGRLKLHHSEEKSIQSSFPNYYPTTMAAVAKLSGAISSK